MKGKHRLKSQADFLAILRKGFRTESPLFRLLYRPNGLSFARFAFVASRAVDKRAVTRNLLKRRVREWIRTHPEFVFKPYDAALFFKKEAASSPRKKFYEELEAIFRNSFR
jgi:ribonuclease P protein component